MKQKIRAETLFDSDWLANDPRIRRVSDLQDVLDKATPYSVDIDVDKILDLEFTNTNDFSTLARNIYKFSAIRPRNLHVYVEIIKKIVLNHNIIPNIRQNIYYALQVNAIQLLNCLVDESIIDPEEISREKHHFMDNKCIYLYEHQKNELAEVIMSDDLDSLQETVSVPGFNINSSVGNVDFFPLSIRKCDLNIIECCCLCGAVKCFKYLLVSGANTKGRQISSFAIAGGNIEIVRLLHQKGISPSNDDINLAIEFHHREIFDWLVELLPAVRTPNLIATCVIHDFMYGINAYNRFRVQQIFTFACFSSSVNIVNILLEKFELNYDEGLYGAVSYGHLDIVEILTSIDDFDVNKLINHRHILTLALDNGHDNIARFLLELKDIKRPSDITKREYDNISNSTMGLVWLLQTIKD